MKPYSLDLRQRVLLDCDAGLPTRKVAEKYRVSPAWVRRLKQRRRLTGSIEPIPHRSGRLPGWHAYGERLRQAIADQPDATLAELKQQLGLTVALSTLWLAIKELGLSFKKSPARCGAGQARRRCGPTAVA